jgi:hypothetical protein
VYRARARPGRFALALQWFYRYFNEQTDLEFESEFELREKGQA